MKFLTFKTTSDTILICDYKSDTIYYTLPVPKNISENEVVSLFADLASEKWMNPMTLKELAYRLHFSIPNSSVDWNFINAYVDYVFNDRKFSTRHA